MRRIVCRAMLLAERKWPMNPQVLRSPQEDRGALESWTRTLPSTLLGWVALAFVVAHGLVLVLGSVFDAGYWNADDPWTTRAVVTASAFAVSAVAGGIAALAATVLWKERSLLMLVPLVLAAFWIIWLVAEIPGWLS
jgi:hypothetical protein